MLFALLLVSWCNCIHQEWSWTDHAGLGTNKYSTVLLLKRKKNLRTNWVYKRVQTTALVRLDTIIADCFTEASRCQSTLHILIPLSSYFAGLFKAEENRWIFSSWICVYNSDHNMSMTLKNEYYFQRRINLNIYFVLLLAFVVPVPEWIWIDTCVLFTF